MIAAERAGVISSKIPSTKWLQLLKEITPGIAKLVVLWDPSTPLVQPKAVTAAAQLVDVKTDVLELTSPSDFETVFNAASARRPDGLLLLSSPLVSINSKQLAELALEHRLPAIRYLPVLPVLAVWFLTVPISTSNIVRLALWWPKSLKAPNPATCLPNVQHASSLL
jgi:hypothetical protein